MQRRDFIKTAAMGAAILSLPGIVQAIAPNASDNRANPFLDHYLNPAKPTDQKVNPYVKRVLDQTVDLASTAHLVERNVVEAFPKVRQSRLESLLEKRLVREEDVRDLHHPTLINRWDTPIRVRTGSLTKKEEAFLEYLQFFGRRLIRPGSRYDREWRKRYGEFSLSPTDCTSYYVDALLKVDDDQFFKGYQKNVARVDENPWKEKAEPIYRPGIFSWAFSMRVRNSYETILIARNMRSPEDFSIGGRHVTDNNKLLRRYFAGDCFLADDYKISHYGYRVGNRRMRASEMAELQADIKEQFYVEPEEKIADYYVLDEMVDTPAFQTFLKETKGVMWIHNFMHLLHLDKGMLYEAKWDKNDLYENTFMSTHAHTRLTLRPDHEMKIHNAILYVPKGTVNEFLEQNA